MKQLALNNLNAFFASLAEKGALYLPVDNEAGQCVYAPWTEGTVWSRKLNTAKSAKEFFLP